MASLKVGDRVSCSSYLSKNLRGSHRYTEIAESFGGFFSGIKSVCVRTKAESITLPGTKDKSSPVDRIEVCAAVTTDRGSVRLVPLRSINPVGYKASDERNERDED